ncbi:MAG: Holliday junction resolvase RuvX [Prochlorotrichaceae cyanobacterium]|jgi:putative Holliday junction resolvase
MAKRVAALGLDIGRKRVGVAGCDGLGLIATGLMTLKRSSFVTDVATLQAIVEERQVELLVVGLPYLQDGSLGRQAREIQRYAQRLSQALTLPVVYVNEQYTSVEAKELMHAAGLSPARDRGTVDRKAAALILQQWLEDQSG